MNSDIKTFRRFVLAFISILFFGLAASSLAQGQVKLVKSLYRVELNGIYVHDWRSQSSKVLSADQGWTTEEGTIISGFRTKGNGILYRGMEMKGDLPKGTPKNQFTFYPLAGAVAKAHNRQKITIKRNLIPACGGELGECSGNEPSGVKTTRKKCAKPNARRPFALDYSELSPLVLKFPFDASNYQFCGEKYPYFASVDAMPTQLRVFGGIDRIAEMRRGQKETMKFSKEFGEAYSLESGKTTKLKKSCPQMSGAGSQRCWTIDVTYVVKRLK